MLDFHTFHLKFPTSLKVRGKKEITYLLGTLIQIEIKQSFLELEVKNRQSTEDNWREKSTSSSVAVKVGLQVSGIPEPPVPGGAYSGQLFHPRY